MFLVLVVAMVVGMMLVLTMQMLCQTVVAAVQKLKLNATMPVKTDNRSTKTAAKRREAGDDQKPGNYFFWYQLRQVTKP